MKTFYTSKTLWFNILALITILAGNIGFGDFVPAAWVNDAGVALTLVINIVLRFVSKEPLGFTNE